MKVRITANVDGVLAVIEAETMGGWVPIKANDSPPRGVPVRVTEVSFADGDRGHSRHLVDQIHGHITRTK